MNECLYDTQKEFLVGRVIFRERESLIYAVCEN